MSCSGKGRKGIGFGMYHSDGPPPGSSQKRRERTWGAGDAGRCGDAMITMDDKILRARFDSFLGRPQSMRSCPGMNDCIVGYIYSEKYGGKC